MGKKILDVIEKAEVFDSGIGVISDVKTVKKDGWSKEEFNFHLEFKGKCKLLGTKSYRVTVEEL